MEEGLKAIPLAGFFVIGNGFWKGNQHDHRNEAIVITKKILNFASMQNKYVGVYL